MIEDDAVEACIRHIGKLALVLPHLACRVASHRIRIELSLFRLTVIIVDTIGFTPVDKMLETMDWADAGCTACSTAQTPCQVSTRLRVESPYWLSIVVQINSSVPALARSSSIEKISSVG